MTGRIMMVLTMAGILAVPAGAQFLAPGGTIPVVANLPGEAGTFWRSDVSITNVSDTDTTVSLELVPELVGGAPTFDRPDPVRVEIPAGQQVVLSNVVQTRFGLQNVKGALQIYSDNGAPLVIGSRTWTPGSGGTYGQGASGVYVANEAWLGGLVQDGFYRTNIGIFWPWDQSATFTIRIHAADGSVVREATVDFGQAGLRQLSLDSGLDVSSLPSGWAEIQCSDDSLGFYAYASRVDQATGDAVFQPAVGRFSDVF